jgi:biotin transport system substrate-specific component
MLRTLAQTRNWTQTYRLASIAAFTILTIIAARISIPFEPVPFTFQPLAVLLAGMLLGARDGMLSQLLYVALIALGLPFDARGLGAAALVGATSGYLFGFVPAAFVTGWIAERGRGTVLALLLAGAAGVAVIYLLGVPVLKTILNLEWAQAWEVGAGLFVAMDLVKVVIAAALTKGGSELIRQARRG